MEIRPCNKCGKKGYWYAICPDCAAKINAEYERVKAQRDKEAQKKAG